MNQQEQKGYEEQSQSLNQERDAQGAGIDMATYLATPSKENTEKQATPLDSASEQEETVSFLQRDISYRVLSKEEQGEDIVHKVELADIPLEQGAQLGGKADFLYTKQGQLKDVHLQGANFTYILGDYRLCAEGLVYRSDLEILGIEQGVLEYPKIASSFRLRMREAYYSTLSSLEYQELSLILASGQAELLGLHAQSTEVSFEELSGGLNSAAKKEEEEAEGSEELLGAEQEQSESLPEASLPQGAAQQPAPGLEEAATEEEEGLEELGEEEGGEEAAAGELPADETPNRGGLGTDFALLSEQLAAEAKQQQEHGDAKTEAKKAQKAALPPKNEKRSLAGKKQLQKTEAQKTQPFVAARFEQALRAKLLEISPTNEQEAAEFSEKNRVEELKALGMQQVNAAKEGSSSALERSNKEEPSEQGIRGKQVERLKGQERGSAPQAPPVDAAVPKVYAPERFEQKLQTGSEELHAKYASEDLSEEQLTKSNEPSFLSALQASKSAQESVKLNIEAGRGFETEKREEQKQSAEQESKESLDAMYGTRGKLLGQTERQQKKTATQDSSERKAVSDAMEAIYERTRKDVEQRLQSLDMKVQQLFQRKAAAAKTLFENYVARKMQAYKDERYGGVWGWARAGYDYVAGMPSEVDAFFVSGRKLYMQEMDKAIKEIAQVVAQELNAAKRRLLAGKKELENYLATLPKSLQKVGQEAAQKIQAKFLSLDKQIDAKQEQLLEHLASSYKEALESIDSRIEELRSESKGLLDQALSSLGTVIQVVQELRQALQELFSTAVDAISAILRDPIGFLGNLIEGISQGFTNFTSKLGEHLKAGFVEWLTGSLGDAGINLPDDVFSLSGIFDLAGQILGINYDYIRGKAVEHLGEKPVRKLEKGFEIFTVIQETGLSGLWDYIQTQFADLKTTVMGAIMDMLSKEVLMAGVQWILGLLTPAGAFVKAVGALIDIGDFFLNNAAKLLELVQSFTASIKALAQGAAGLVAGLIEKALAASVPVLIDFLASLLGLGGIADKVKGIIESIQERVDAAIEGLIAKGKDWLANKGKRKKKKKGEEPSPEEQRASLDQLLEEGEAIIRNPDLRDEEIQSQVFALGRERDMQLAAYPEKQGAEEHSWILQGAVETMRLSKRIIRSATQATNEEEVKEGHFSSDKIGKIVPFSVESEQHKVWINRIGRDVQIMMASTPTPVEDKITEWGQKIQLHKSKDKSKEDTEKYAKIKSMYGVVKKSYEYTREKSVEAAKLAAEQEVLIEKKNSLRRVDNDNKITSKEADRRKKVVERESKDMLSVRLEEVNYHVEQNEIALVEAIKRLLLLFEEKDEVKIGEREEIVSLSEDDKNRLGQDDYYDIAVIGVGSAAARWLYTNPNTYKKGVVLGDTGGWKDRGQEFISHPKSIVSPITPAKEEQGLVNQQGETIFERADTHVNEIEKVIEKSGFKRLKESCKSIHKEGEWSLISYGSKRNTIAARKIVLAAGAGPESEVSKEIKNSNDEKAGYKKVVSLNEFMREVEGLKPEDIKKRQEKFGKRSVLIFGGNAAVDAINTALNLGFEVHPCSRSGFSEHLPGTKNTSSKNKYGAEFEKPDNKHIVGFYESHRILKNGKVVVKFTGGTIITVDQLVTAIGPDSRQIATDEKQAGPLAILGGPRGVKKILRPIYDLGKCYDDEVFATVLGLESEDGLLEVIGAAAYRAAAFTNDTKEAIDRYNELKNEKNILEKRARLDADKKKLEKLNEMLGVFSRVQNKFNNTKKAHSVSILVAEQLGPLNSTIEAINRVNKTINDKEAKEKVLEQIKKDGVNMQIDSATSISKYIYINWSDFSVEENLNPELKQRLSEQAAKAVVAKRGKTTHPHGLTWDDAVLTIKEKIKECLLNLKK